MPHDCEPSSADIRWYGLRVSVCAAWRESLASARKVVRKCFWYGTLYWVRDPGDSRRASLKRWMRDHQDAGAVGM